MHANLYPCVQTYCPKARGSLLNIPGSSSFTQIIRSSNKSLRKAKPHCGFHLDTMKRILHYPRFVHHGVDVKEVRGLLPRLLILERVVCDATPVSAEISLYVCEYSQAVKKQRPLQKLSYGREMNSDYY